jgi:Domain of unknown function (DUF1905)/Bacteriocin-protection, YdeI or OmpD-Associated
MGTYTFEAVLIRPEGVGTWTYLNIPGEISAIFSSKGQVKVKGTINEYPFRSTALPRGDGTHYLVVGKEIRERIQSNQGDTVRVVLELDKDERLVEVPVELKRALANHPQAAEAFEEMTFSHKKEWVNWIFSAKKAETRQNRIEKAIIQIVQGRNLRKLSPRK